MKTLFIIFLSLCSQITVAQGISAQKFSQVFKDYNACFILYNLDEHKIISKYNPYNRCSQRISPDSTFKIPLSLMAFSQGIISEDSVFKWDGKKVDIPEHGQDQNPNSWLKYSVVWVSQMLTPQLGQSRIKHYLAGFEYGNQDFSGDLDKNNGLTHAWLSSSLKISAEEQLNFLIAMLKNELPITKEAMEQTKKNLFLGTLDNGAEYYGKTGSGRNGANERTANPSKLRDGWFIGFIEKNNKHYIFVSNLTDKVAQATIDGANGALIPYGGQVVKPITIQLLNDYFANI